MGSFRVFVAGSYRERDRAAEAARLLNHHGSHMIVSRWHAGPAIPGGDAGVLDRKERQAICRGNEDDLRQADVFVLLASPYCQGSLVEFGDAWHAGKKMHVVGDPMRCSIMLDRSGVTFSGTIEDVLKELAKK